VRASGIWAQRIPWNPRHPHFKSDNRPAHAAERAQQWESPTPRAGLPTREGVCGISRRRPAYSRPPANYRGDLRCADAGAPPKAIQFKVEAKTRVRIVRSILSSSALSTDARKQSTFVNRHRSTGSRSTPSHITLYSRQRPTKCRQISLPSRRRRWPVKFPALAGGRPPPGNRTWESNISLTEAT
jgi:hypothetical protein